MADAVPPRILLEQLLALPEAQRRHARVSRTVATAFLEAMRKETNALTAAPPDCRLPDLSHNEPYPPHAARGRPMSTPAAPCAAGSSGAEERLAAFRAQVLTCAKCPHLAASRTQVVFGIGNPRAQLMFVGEAPGADEDARGEPFVGRAGQLLTKIIETMEFSRDEVYIANVLKCRPNMPPGASGNRRPTPEEIATCLPYLQEQIRIVRPQVIVALGAIALEGLLGSATPVNKTRGQWQQLVIPGSGENGESLSFPLMPTYHPAYLLRNQSLTEKRKVWEDMLLVLEKMGRPISDKQRGFFLKK